MKGSAQEGTLPAGAERPMEWGSKKGEGFATLPLSLAKRIANLDLSTGESDTPPTHMEVFCTTRRILLGELTSELLPRESSLVVARKGPENGTPSICRQRCPGVVSQG